MEEISIKDMKPNDVLKTLLDYISKQKEYTSLLLNGQLGSFLIDGFESHGLKTNVPVNPQEGPYEILALKNIKIYIDPLMKWTDTLMIFSNKENKRKTIKVIHSNNLI